MFKECLRPAVRSGAAIVPSDRLRLSCDTHDGSHNAPLGPAPRLHSACSRRGTLLWPDFGSAERSAEIRAVFAFQHESADAGLVEARQRIDLRAVEACTARSAPLRSVTSSCARVYSEYTIRSARAIGIVW